MNENEILTAISQMWPGAEARNISWVWPTLESLHFFGLCLVIGGMSIVDLRLMGFFKSIPVKAALAFLPWVLFGFAINALTGWAFFAADPNTYWSNPGFILKMIGIVLAGLNAALFTVMEHRHAYAIGPGGDTTTFTKVTAALSLFLWAMVLILGRMLPNTGMGTN
jgi:hypothetical protein